LDIKYNKKHKFTASVDDDVNRESSLIKLPAVSHCDGNLQPALLMLMLMLCHSLITIYATTRMKFLSSALYNDPFQATGHCQQRNFYAFSYRKQRQTSDMRITTTWMQKAL